MKDQHREIFFFTEKYTGNDYNHQEIIQPWKNTLNYINRFSISEEDGFDIAGVFTMKNSEGSTKSRQTNPKYLNEILKKNYEPRAEILKNLWKASGIVHVFISGMKLYKDHPNRKNESMVELNQIIRDCFKNVNRKYVKSLQVSLMEFRASGKIRPSMGVRINSMDVNDLYKRQNDSLMSFGNDLDRFYGQCLHEKIQNEVVQFFHAQQLTTDEFESYQYKFENLVDERFLTNHRQNRKTYTKILARFASTENNEGFDTDWNIKFVKAQHRFNHNISQLEHRKKSVYDLSQNQDYKLFIGYRASFQVPLHLRFNKAFLAELTNFSQQKLTHSKLWKWANGIIQSEQEYQRQCKFFKKVKSFNSCLQ